MKKIIILVFTIIVATFSGDKTIVIDKDEAQNAYELLNQIRLNPENFEDQFPFLRYSKVKKTELIWNDTLAKVAENKAYDMAKRNYYGHVDPSGYGINYYINKSGYKLNPSWLKNKRDNNFESIAAQVDNGVSAISTFIIDKGVPSFGHRIHLLGLDEWNGSLKDIGIGFVRREKGSKYKTYVCVIIAKHDW